MLPIPASPARGGLSPATTPSVETGESNTFTDSTDVPRVRDSDNTTVNVKPTDNNAPINLMQPADESSSPLPNGDGDGGDDSRGDPTPTPRTGQQEYFYTNDGKTRPPFCARAE